MTLKQSREELLEHLEDCVGFLEDSCAAFDEGKRGEAKRLANTIRILLWDKGRIHSLFSQLGWKEAPIFWNSAKPFDPDRSLSQTCLIGFVFAAGKDPSYWAPLEEGPPSCAYEFVDFESWWNQVVIADSHGEKFSRADILLDVAHKDGGSHVDPKLDGPYAQLTRNNSVGWVKSSDDGPDSPIVDVEKFTIRQIAYEVLESIDQARKLDGYA